MRDKFDVAFANDTDADRHGIVTRTAGLMNPNHFLAAAIAYLFEHRPQWGADAAIGKTIVCSSMIDRVASKLGRRLVEVPVGFKWFVEGLGSGAFGFARRGERRRLVPAPGRHGVDHRQGRHHDGPAGGRNHRRTPAAIPSELYAGTDRRNSARPSTRAIDVPATPPAEERAQGARRRSSSACNRARRRPGDRDPLTKAPGNGQPFGGIKVETDRAGSRPGRRAPRTSTRSTPRVSAARIISARSRTMPRP